IGIKGVGVAPLSIIAKEAGITVFGCDIADEFITSKPLRNAGITPLVGFDPDHVQSVDMVITTGAHGGFKNPEVVRAKELGIPVVTQGQAVGMFMNGEVLGKSYKGISVTGCHGKTTTTAIIATVLKSAGKDPTFVVGTGEIPSLGGSGHFGNGEYFVAEADEYATEPTFDKTPKFMWQFPTFLVLTNIEFDHPDVYASLDATREAYALFTKNIQQGGLLIINGDDPQTPFLLKSYIGNVLTFGFGLENSYVLKDVSSTPHATTFTVIKQNELYGTFEIKVPGVHNALNAMAAIVIAAEVGLSVAEIHKGLLAFTGTKRRLEYLGQLKTGAILYDDYAHHPTEIKKTLETLKKLYPDKKLICLFQPHTYSRTKSLFDDFIYSFKAADMLLLAEIYASLREAPDVSISSAKLGEKVKQTGKNVEVFSSLPNMLQYVQEKRFNDSYVLVTMGAGDIYKVGESLIQ
ncbi:MAG: UDP-N-acetylmuramate--L-alanine ligase, partial [Patescibacteria group bacterium]|nr:UDP-N-acetylmuramate--L-alanine ligase [Patescibacteria group bacterium]